MSSHIHNDTRVYSFKQKFNIIQEINPNIFDKINKLKNKENKKPLIIAFTGASSSGKSYLANLLKDILADKISASCFTQDNYYRNFKEDFKETYTLKEFYETINFDDPSHIRFDKMLDDLKLMKSLNIGEKIKIPKVIFGTDKEFPLVVEQGIEFEIHPVIITEGIYSLINNEINNYYDLKIFINMDNWERKQVWEERNKKEGRFFNNQMWETTIQAFDLYIKPSKINADLVLDNTDHPEEFKNMFKELFLN